jgi:nitrogen fixation protein FixH
MMRTFEESLIENSYVTSKKFQWFAREHERRSAKCGRSPPVEAFMKWEN